VDGSIFKKIAKECLPGLVPRHCKSMRHGIEGKMEMHGIPGASIEQFPEEYGCRILDVQPDSSAGEEWPSL